MAIHSPTFGRGLGVTAITGFGSMCEGLTRVGRERVLQDTPAIRGMIDKVGYLIEWAETNEEFKQFGRRSQRKRMAR